MLEPTQRPSDEYRETVAGLCGIAYLVVLPGVVLAALFAASIFVGLPAGAIPDMAGMAAPFVPFLFLTFSALLAVPIGLVLYVLPVAILILVQRRARFPGWLPLLAFFLVVWVALLWWGPGRLPLLASGDIWPPFFLSLALSGGFAITWLVAARAGDADLYAIRRAAGRHVSAALTALSFLAAMPVIITIAVVALRVIGIADLGLAAQPIFVLVASVLLGLAVVPYLYLPAAVVFQIISRRVRPLPGWLPALVVLIALFVFFLAFQWRVSVGNLPSGVGVLGALLLALFLMVGFAIYWSLATAPAPQAAPAEEAPEKRQIGRAHV